MRKPTPFIRKLKEVTVQDRRVSDRVKYKYDSVCSDSSTEDP